LGIDNLYIAHEITVKKLLMQYKSNKGFTGMGQLGILLILFGACAILAGIVQFVFGMQMVPDHTGFDGLQKALENAFKKPENINLMRWMQFFSTFFFFFAPSLIYSWICNGKNIFWLGFNKYINGFQIMIGFLIMFSANLMAEPLADFSKSLLAHLPKLNALALNLENAYNEQVQMFSAVNTGIDFLLSLFIMAFLPALFEEVFFRAVVQNLLVNWWKKPILAILVTSIIFSLIHGSVYLFLSRIVLGFALGLMYYKSKNIWVNIIAHFLNNGIIVTTMFVYSLQHKKIDVNAVELKTDWWFVFLAGGLLVILFKSFNKYSENNKLKIENKRQSIFSIESSNTSNF
jgi:membrane protease YdiL (CAAX protease family)